MNKLQEYMLELDKEIDTLSFIANQLHEAYEELKEDNDNADKKMEIDIYNKIDYLNATTKYKYYILHLGGSKEMHTIVKKDGMNTTYFHFINMISINDWLDDEIKEECKNN